MFFGLYLKAPKINIERKKKVLLLLLLLIAVMRSLLMMKSPITVLSKNR
jgi:hypothetical protein